MIVLGFTLFDGKIYCLDQFLNALYALDYPVEELGVICVENSETLELFRRMELEFGEEKGYKFMKVVRSEPAKLGESKYRVITRALEVLRKESLKHEGMTHLLSLESDLPPPSDSLRRLLKIDAENTVVSGWFASRANGYPTICRTPDRGPLCDAEGKHARWATLQARKDLVDQGDVVDVDWTGFGCTLIRREILKKYPFRMGESDILGADVVTPSDWRRAGITILVDAELKVPHLLEGGKCL